MWAEECGKSECRPVTGRIRIERERHYPMRKQADFHMVFHYKKVCRTFIGGKANECSLPHVHSPALTQEGCITNIVKSAQLPNVGSCEGGLLKRSFRKAWAVCRETDKQGSYGAGVQQWALATRPAVAWSDNCFFPLLLRKIDRIPSATITPYNAQKNILQKIYAFYPLYAFCIASKERLFLAGQRSELVL